MSGSSSRYQRVEAIYQQALDLPCERRGDFLGRACGGDDALENEVQALLRHYEAASGTFLAGPAHALAANGHAAQPVPDRIGPYRILRVLGRGGMGVVYEAEQARPQRHVALKVLRSDAISPEALRRFEHEADALARLRHPGIAQVYDFGVGEVCFNGVSVHRQPYFAMELVSGVSLKEFGERRRADTGAMLELFARVCDAIQHAHQNGVIHRDLKPANILVNDAGDPKVLDFGVARLASENGDASLTQPGHLLGTLAYMSPEQATGDWRARDTRSDVYSLGVVAFELLTGKLPLDVSSSSAGQAIRTLTEQDPARASRLRAELRGDVDAILAKALEKDASRRYQSAAELAADVRRHLQGEPVAAKAGSTLYILRKLVVRHTLAVTVAAAFALLVILSVLSQSFLYRAQLHQSALAKEAQFQAEQKAAQAAAVLTTLQEVLRSPDPDLARGPDYTVREMLDEVSAEVDQFKNQPEIEAAIRTTLGRTYSTLALYDKARSHLNVALEIRQRLFGNEHVEVAETQFALAEVLHELSEFEAARTLYRRALETRRRLLGLMHFETANVLLKLSSLALADHDLEESERLGREALHVYQSIGEHSGPAIGDCLNQLGYIAREARRHAEAEEHFRAALAHDRRQYGDRHPKVFMTMKHLAALLRATGRYDESEVLCREALEGVRDMMGPDHPHVAAVLNSIAILRHKQRRFDESEARFEEALEIYRKTHKGDDLSVAVCLNNFAAMVAEKGDPARAVTLAREALDMRRRLHAEWHVDVMNCLSAVATYLTAAGDLPAAVEALRDGINRARQMPPAKRKMLAVRLAHFGRFLIERTGARSAAAAAYQREAEDALREAHVIYSKDFAPNYWRKRDASMILGRHLWRQGRFEEAEGYLTEGVDIWLARGPSDRDALSAWSSLVRFYAAWGAHSERLMPRLQHALASDPSAETLLAWASRVIVHANLAKPLYELTLEALRVAERRAPDDARVLQSIGAAHFRLEDFETSLHFLRRADALHFTQTSGGAPEDLAFIAMCLHRLGRVDDARAAFERMCTLLGDDRTDHPAAKELRLEVERTLQTESPRHTNR